MKIVADGDILDVTEAFEKLGELTLLPGREIGPADVRDADALIVRSITRVDRALVESSRLRFVATATSGRNHLDLPALESLGITVRDAAGCNANAVAEYVLAALAELLLAKDHDLQGRSVAIVGVGHVGRRLLHKLQPLGLDLRLCDPFVEADYRQGLRQGQGRLPDLPEGLHFCSLDEALEADVICLHVPCTRSGKHPTWQMLDASRLGRLRSGTVLISAGRGEVIDEAALKRRMQRDADLALVLDVFEREPEIDRGWCQLAQIATPHIAGYSADAKASATRCVLEAFCEHFGLDMPAGPSEGAPSGLLTLTRLDGSAEGRRQARAIIERFSPRAVSDDFCRSLAAVPAGTSLAKTFDAQRRRLARRREFSA